MDEIATRAIAIGVAIFVTLIIITVVIFEFSEIQKVYKISAETDITFEERLNELDKYNDANNDFRGIDVRNTVAKYKDDKSVAVCIDESGTLKCNNIIIDEEDYNEEYSSRLEVINSINRIVFTKRFKEE